MRPGMPKLSRPRPPPSRVRACASPPRATARDDDGIGVNVRTGIAAADPDILPVGSVIQVSGLGDEYNGIYTIMDTGPKVQGRHIDIYMWSCNEALELGRRTMQIVVLRLGWNPKASTPRLIDRLFRQREASQGRGRPLAALSLR